MNNSIRNKILKFSLREMTRNKWLLFYMLFYLGISFALYFISNDLVKVLTGINNISLIATPLMSILFGSIFYYNSKDFIVLLLSQPISRWTIFSSLYLSVVLVLCASLLIGIGLPMLIFGILQSEALSLFLLILTLSITPPSHLLATLISGKPLLLLPHRLH